MFLAGLAWKRGNSQCHSRKGLDQDQDDDLVAMLARAEAVADLLQTRYGTSLLIAYRRAANILRIEERKDGPFSGAISPSLLCEPAEVALDQSLKSYDVMSRSFDKEAYRSAMNMMATTLRAPLDSFFEKVTVNAPEPELRRNRLRLLNQVRSIMDQIADFSRIEG